MKNTLLLFMVLAITLLYSCKNNEDKAVELVTRFLNETSNENFKRNKMDYSMLTSEYKHVFDSSGYYPIKNQKISAQAETDSTMLVKSIGDATNALGETIIDQQDFLLKKRNGDWKIDNSNNFLVDYSNFKIDDKEFNNMWDKEQAEVLYHIQENVKLEVIQSAEGSSFSESREGMLKLINNSDYDIRKVRIIIEHFDIQGKSVNTDEEIIMNVVRKHGYRDFDWYSGDCLNCYSQVFKIIFIDENN